ncbi:hypothetical protein [Sporolactobacillus sp. KGMB 08714]|uniref:hypothetical protein n=1 Tax=Sporolactobacillus sp. KGMB 08714 TaxID=3064704 RepID=UPI002FBD3C77
MLQKTIYENEISKLDAHFDGELIELTQYLEGKVTGFISIYKPELDDLVKFVEGSESDE